MTLSKLSIIVANTKFSEKKEPKMTRKTKKNMARYSIYESIKLYIKLLHPSRSNVMKIETRPAGTLLKLNTSKKMWEFLSEPSRNKGASALTP